MTRRRSVESALTGRQRPYSTILPGRTIHPPLGRTLRHHLMLGAAVGFASAGLAVCWLFIVGLVGGDEMNGAALVVFAVPVAAICGAIVGAGAALALGALLWPTLARYVYPTVGGLIQGRIMWAYGQDAYDAAPLAAFVGIGSTLIAVTFASRSTAAMLVELSRSSETRPAPERIC